MKLLPFLILINVIWGSEYSFINNDGIKTHDSVVISLQEDLKSKSAEVTKVVLERRPAQGHCPRPHDYKEGALRLDISPLNSVLSVTALDDASAVGELIAPEFGAYGEVTAVATAGALTSMETLVDTLLPMGLIPAVVPEFKGITVGGAIQGLAAESSSARYGFFHDMVVEFEALLMNGTMVMCSKKQNEDLFLSVPGSFGSIAIITSAKMLCVKAAPFVKVTVSRYGNISDTVDALAETHAHIMAAPSTAPGSDATLFLEGFGYGRNDFVKLTGRFAPEVSGLKLLRCNVWGGRWFFNQVRNARDGTHVVYPTKDYLFRHDRGSFWMASYRIPQIIGRLMGGLLDSRAMFNLANALPWAFPKKQICLQDFMLPRNTVVSFFEKLETILELWPMWLLPMRNVESRRNGSLFAQPSTLQGHLCNVGAYGIPKKKYEFIPKNMEMESLLKAHGGRKVFYSHAFYTKEEFYDNIYSGQDYHAVRNKYGSSVLPEIYDKVVVKNGKL